MAKGGRISASIFDRIFAIPRPARVLAADPFSPGRNEPRPEGGQAASRAARIFARPRRSARA